MGYTGPYTLGSRCLSEFLATCTVIFLGESVLANELLSKTKGHGMGFGWVAYGFAFSFFVAIACFGQISAHLNPAYCLGLWLLGDLDAADFFALSGSELAGAMLGAILVYIHFLPHFKTLPEPPALDDDEMLLRSRDAATRDGLSLASYDTRKGDASMRPLKENLEDIRYYLARPGTLREPQHSTLLEQVLGHHEALDVEGKLRRRSVQVCDLHERLKHLDSRDLPWGVHRPGTGRGGSTQNGAAGNANGARMQRSTSVSIAEVEHDRQKGAAAQDGASKGPQGARRARLDALYQAAVRADQNGKLSIFATRPAIPSVFFNWVVEFLGTVVLVAGAMLIEARGEGLDGQWKILFAPVEAYLVGQFITVIILGLGGPTGVAINPARDFGPRLMHWLLPIAGKGSSEWGYAWVPVSADLVGGLAGAALFKGINQITLHALDQH